jgi:hypothetical protein
MEFGAVAQRFGVGALTANPEVVAGGLSNHLWRMETDRGSFAVKEMVINADRPDFVTTVEVAYGIEARAYTVGVPRIELHG